MKTVSLWRCSDELWENRPKGFSKYWYIGFDHNDEYFAGDPRQATWRNTQIDENRLKLGNVFETKEDAFIWLEALYTKANTKKPVSTTVQAERHEG